MGYRPAPTMEATRCLLDQRQAELVKSKSVLEMLKTKREVTEKEEPEAEVSGDTSPQPPHSGSLMREGTDNSTVSEDSRQPRPMRAPLNLPFSSSVKFIRSQTPTENRALKNKIEALLEDLQDMEEQQYTEKLLQVDLEQEQAQHEATAAALEAQLIRRQYQGSDFENLIRTQVQKSEPVSTFFDSFTQRFRTQRPDIQQKMKGEVEAFLAELDEVVKDLDKEAQAQVKL